MIITTPSYIIPDWPAPENVHAYQTTRLGGFSLSPFHSFNLGTHVNDAPENVEKNRRKLREELSLPNEPFWLEQVHGNICVDAQNGELENKAPRSHPPKADASFTRQAGQVCIVMTADCLPILVCSRDGKEIAAIHAGWRGLYNGVITEALKHFKSEPSSLMAWLGPAIGPDICELNAEIRLDFVQKNEENEGAFNVREPNHWFADLYELARIELRHFGISDIYGGEFCTYRDSELFFSHRRDQGKTGRMASMIWLS